MTTASPTRSCAALVPTPTGRHRCGIRCRMVAGVVPLCDDHLARLQVGLNTPAVVYVHTASPAVVYYIGHPDSQCVKIGTSTRYRQRFTAICERFPHSVLLAVEPGGFDLERQRHTQFADLRVIQRGQREWYTKTPDLMGHVNTVRAQWGDPWSYDLPKGSRTNLLATR